MESFRTFGCSRRNEIALFVERLRNSDRDSRVVLEGFALTSLIALFVVEGRRCSLEDHVALAFLGYSAMGVVDERCPRWMFPECVEAIAECLYLLRTHLSTLFGGHPVKDQENQVLLECFLFRDPTFGVVGTDDPGHKFSISALDLQVGGMVVRVIHHRDATARGYPVAPFSSVPGGPCEGSVPRLFDGLRVEGLDGNLAAVCLIAKLDAIVPTICEGQDPSRIIVGVQRFARGFSSLAPDRLC